MRSRRLFLSEILSHISDGTIANMIWRRLEKAPFAQTIFSDIPLRQQLHFFQYDHASFNPLFTFWIDILLSVLL